MNDCYFVVKFINGEFNDFNRRCKYVENFGEPGRMIMFRESKSGEVLAIINASEIRSIDKYSINGY